MPRYVLLEFDDTDQANRFVAKVLKKSVEGAPFYVRGLFAKPTKYCECGQLTDRRQGLEVRRGAKFGWMVHKPCGLPRKQHSISPRNLLDPINSPILQQTAFLTLMGGWRGKKRRHTPLENYPISISTKDMA